MIFVHLLLHLLLHLFPHLSFEDDGDADGLIISSYTRRCVSLSIVPHRVSSLSSSSSSPLYSVRRNCPTISPCITATFRPSFVSPIIISQPETSFSCLHDVTSAATRASDYFRSSQERGHVLRFSTALAA